MKTSRPASTRLSIPILLIILTSYACSSSDSGGDVEPVYIPVLTTQWLNSTNRNDIFTFTQLGNTNVGSFTGTEIVNSKTYRFIGSYSNRTIELIYDPGPGGTGLTGKSGKYTGTITGEGNTARIELNSSTLGALVLIR